MIEVRAATGPEHGQGHADRSERLRTALAASGIEAPITILDYPGITADDVRQAKSCGRLVVVLGAYDGDERPDVWIWPGFADRTGLQHPCLQGPEYAILPPQYQLVTARKVRRRLSEILITLGGSDPDGVTSTLLDVLGPWPERIKRKIGLHVIIGPHFERAGRLLRWHSRPGVALRRGEVSLLHHLRRCDVVICGGGQTLFEVARTATPAIVIETGVDQRHNARALGKARATWNLGPSHKIEERHVLELVKLIGSSRARRRLSGRIGDLVDGRGTQRCVEAVWEACKP